MDSKFTREINFTPAFSKRNKDPKKDYGIGCVEMVWVLKGPLGAISLSFFTGWYLPDDCKRLRSSVTSDFNMFELKHGYMAYHSPTKKYENEAVSKNKCNYLGVPCYCDGSFSLGEKVEKALIEKGDEAAWEVMEEFYASWLEDKK